MNVKSAEEIAQIKRLVLLGNGIRSVRIQTGAASATIQYYRKELIFEAAFQGKDILCKCGKKIGHRGWCSPKLERSPKRIEFLKKWHRSGGINAILKHRCAPAIIRTWKEPEIYVRSKHDLEVVVAKHIPSFVPHLLREDLSQDLLVAILSGEETIENLPNVVLDYVKRARKILPDRWKTISLDATVPGTDGLRLIDTIPAEEIDNSESEYG